MVSASDGAPPPEHPSGRWARGHRSREASGKAGRKPLALLLLLLSGGLIQKRRPRHVAARREAADAALPYDARL